VIALLTQCRDIQADMLLGHQARRAIGLESETAAQLAAAQKLQTDAALSVEQNKLLFTREALRALVGSNTDAPDRLTFTALPASKPGMPDNLSFNLLTRRPDLQALRGYVASSLSQVEVAQAEFYPSFDIQAFFGVYSIRLAELFSMSASRQINLIPGMRLPIFDSGLLNANLDARSASANEAVAVYNQAVVDAVRDVAQLGSTLKDLEKRSSIEKSRLANLSFASSGAQASHARGLTSRVASEEARLPVLIQEILLEDLHSQQLISELGLLRALGGGG
jgi:multidrug efflux system outer membrane protein